MITELGMIFNHSNISQSAKATQKVKELGIRHGDELPVTFNILHDVPRIIIYLKNLTGKTFKLDCAQDWTIDELKKQIKARNGNFNRRICPTC